MPTITNKIAAPALLLLAITVMIAPAARAAVINFSFEDPVLSEGAFVTTVPGWTTSGANVRVVNVPTTGSMRVSDQTNLDGNNAVLLYDSTIRQTVDMVAANTQYTVTYRLGDRGDATYGHPYVDVLYDSILESTLKSLAPAHKEFFG